MTFIYSTTSHRQSLTFDKSHRICIMSSASFLLETPLRYHKASSTSKSMSWSLTELTTLLPFAPFTFTCNINAFAIILKKLSRNPTRWFSDGELAMENPVDGSREPIKTANALGATSGSTLLSNSVTLKIITFGFIFKILKCITNICDSEQIIIVITCLWTLAVPVCNRLNKFESKSYWLARYNRPTLLPLRADTIESISKQYESVGVTVPLLDAVSFLQTDFSHSSRIIIASFWMASTIWVHTWWHQKRF